MVAKVAFIDCFAGLTGTMALGALLDAGVERDVLVAQVRTLAPGQWDLHAERAVHTSMAGTAVRLRFADPDATCDLEAFGVLLGASHLDAAVQRRCLDIATILAAHQATTTLPLRATVEIAGVVVGLALLGVEQVYAALPASAEDAATDLPRRMPDLLRDTNAPLFDPTAAAMLAGLAVLGRPPMALQRTGYGLGGRGLPLLDATRLWLGESTATPPADAPRPTMAGMERWFATPRAEATPTADEPQADAVLLLDYRADADLDAYDQLARSLQERLGLPVHLCWADAGGVRPTVEACMNQGVRRMVVAPLFRTPARRAIAELHGMLQWAQRRWPGSSIVVANPVWTPDHLLGTLARHAADALASAPSPDVRPTTLLLVAPGSDDEDENAEWFRLGRLLWERRRDPHATVDVCFSQRTQPDIAAALRRCQHGDAGRVVVLPTTLLRGATTEGIAAEVAAVAGTLGERVTVAPAVSRIPTASALIAKRVREAIERPADAPVVTHHGHTHVYTWDAAPLLPPRYQQGRTVSAAPMPAAALVYGDDGRVDWNAIWGDFCDLALAGGPPHRDTLLEPTDPATVAADPAAYAQVLAELERGLRMVTGLPVVAGAPGWIGVGCTDEEMALWMLRAIVVENVSVRREGTVLLLPAGPAFRLAHEIKNVVTVVAKTHHYWTEHRAAMV